ncbi:hypothetical protein R1sor_007479 [Riccia sorocarpa]|uniref:Uncharacterized protein n=1 Tax=Riccia sorocarpa TaxID=122646 RepID=A0ABD3HQL1_9MARC
MAEPTTDAQPRDDAVEADVGILLQRSLSVSGIVSPRQPARKTRVISMSHVRSPVSFVISKSPVRISRRWSPSAVPTGSAGEKRTLRSIKKNLRIQKGLDSESLLPFSEVGAEFCEGASQATATCAGNRLPPSLRDSQKWKGVHSLKDTSKHKKVSASQPEAVGDTGRRRFPFSLDNSALPVIEAPSASIGRRHPYVTRALFQGPPDVSLPTGVERFCHKEVVGVYMDCFQEGEFDVSDCCFPEYVCCGLVAEFRDTVLQLDKVEVHVFSTGRSFNTFKSNCEFAEKYRLCSRHSNSGLQLHGSSSPDPNVFYAGSTEALELPSIDGSILSMVCDSDSEHDSDWSVRSQVLDEQDSDSDWECFQEEICSEDLPRLGIVQPDQMFATDPLAWQLADEYWTSASTTYSHDTGYIVADELVKMSNRSGAEFLAHDGCDSSMHFSEKRTTGSLRLCCECRKLTRLCCPKCKGKAMCMGACFVKHHQRKICCADAGNWRRCDFRKVRNVTSPEEFDYEAFTTVVFVAQAIDGGPSRSSGFHPRVHYTDSNGQLKEYDRDLASALLQYAVGQQRSVVLPGNTGQLMLFNFETMEQCFVDGFSGSIGEAILADRAPVKFFIEVPWNLERMMNLVRVAESTTRRKIFGMTIEKLRDEEYLTLTLPERARPRTIVATEVEYQPRVGDPRFEEFVSALEQNLLACPKLIESFLKLTVPGSSEDSKVQIVFKPFGKKRNESLTEKKSQAAFWMSMAAPIAAAHLLFTVKPF